MWICCLYHKGLFKGFDHLDQYITLWKANPWLSLALLVGAPLTEQKKKESGVCPIAIREVFLCLAGRICYSAVHSHLNDCLIPYGQVGVGVKDGFTCHLLQPPAIDANDLCSLHCPYLVYVN